MSLPNNKINNVSSSLLSVAKPASSSSLMPSNASSSKAAKMSQPSKSTVSKKKKKSKFSFGGGGGGGGGRKKSGGGGQKFTTHLPGIGNRRRGGGGGQHNSILNGGVVAPKSTVASTALATTKSVTAMNMPPSISSSLAKVPSDLLKKMKENNNVNNEAPVVPAMGMLVAPRGTKNDKGQYINRVDTGKRRAAEKSDAMHQHRTTFALQLADSMDGLSTCKHGYAIPGEANSSRIRDLPSLLQRMARRNKQTGVVTPYDQDHFFKELLRHDFEIVGEDPRFYSGYILQAGDELVIRHRDPNAFHPHNDVSINMVKKLEETPKVDNDKRLRGKGAKGFNEFAMPRVFTSVRDFRVKNVTDADRKKVIDQMMTLNEDDLKLFLKKQMNTNVALHFCSKLGIGQRNRDGTRRTAAQCMELIAVEIKKRKEDKGNSKPASK